MENKFSKEDETEAEIGSLFLNVIQKLSSPVSHIGYLLYFHLV